MALGPIEMKGQEELTVAGLSSTFPKDSVQRVILEMLGPN
jgi:hypothetical protein